MVLIGALACTPAAAAPELVRGEVVLSVPDCDLFIVRTSTGFTAVRKHQHWAVFEGDYVQGPLHAEGSCNVEILGQTTIAAEIEHRALDRDAAKRLFYRSCIPQSR